MEGEIEVFLDPNFLITVLSYSRLPVYPGGQKLNLKHPSSAHGDLKLLDKIWLSRSWDLVFGTLLPRDKG